MKTLGSLFAGIGGFDAGFERAGFETVWQVEIDPTCRRILARHFPRALRFEDVRECGAHNLPPVDVITFGSPCQDLSLAGKRAGLKGERSGLFFEAIRILRELRPALAVWENVPGALSSHAGRDFAAVLAAFRDGGARDLCWRVLDSRYFGVPQRRRRVFLVADFRGERAGEILFEPESLRGDLAPRREAREELARDVAACIRQSSGERGCGLDYEAGITVTATLAASGAGTARPAGMASEPDFLIAHALTAEGHDASEDGTGRGVPLIPFDTAQITSAANRSRAEPGMPCPTIHQGGGAHVAAPIAFDWQSGGDGRMSILEDGSPVLQTKQTPAVAFHTANSNMQGPIHKEECAWTVEPHPSQTRHAVMSGMTVRRLTPTECERLQAFPDGWTAHDAEGQPISDSARYRMLGNAVTVSVAEWIARRMARAWDERKDANE